MRAIRKFPLSLTGIAIVLLLAVALTSVGANPRSTQSSARPASMPMPVMPMKLVAPLFIEDDVTTSVMTMVNSMAKPIDVDVILTGLDGNEIAKRTTTIASHSVQQLAAQDLLQGASVFGPAYGSVLLLPHEVSILAAQMSVVHRGGSVSDIEEEFAMIMEVPRPAHFRAVANNLAAPPIIAIRSLSNQERVITIDCLGKPGRQIKSDMSIEPNQTLLVQACMESGAKRIADLKDLSYTQQVHEVHEGIGLSVSSLAPSKEFAVFGLGIQGNELDPQLRAMSFTDVDQLNSSTAIYPGAISESSLLGIYAPELRVSIANFGDSPSTATISVSKGSGNDSTQQQIATIKVPPRSAVARNLAEKLPDQLGLDGSLIVHSDGPIGETLSDIQLLSRSSDGLPASVPLLWKDQAQVFNGGQHPWRIDGGFTSTVLLFNPDQHEANSIRVFIYSENKTWTKDFSLPPLATVPVRLNDIITKQEKDEKGKTLPPTSASGLVLWFTLRNPKIFGQLVQTDRISGVVRPFACFTQVVVCGGTIDNTLVLSGATAPASAHAQACGSCGGCSCVTNCGDFSGNGTWSNWSTGNTSIATLVNSAGSTATFKGVNPGSTGSYAIVTDSYFCSGTASGNIDVSPALNSISPAQGPVGSTITVTLNGNGFGSNCRNITINAGSGITPTCNSVNNTQIQASFAISASAGGGNRSVNVTINSQTGPNQNFYVQIPTYFVATGASSVLNTYCAANQAFYAEVNYQLADQLTNPILAGGFTPQESVSQNGGQYSPFQNFATPPSTNSDGTFEDRPVGTCFSAPPPPNRCIPVLQKFQILVPGASAPFPISTTTSRTDCEQGIKITVSPGSTYTFGTTN